MNREEVVNNPDYKAIKAALEWWRNNVCSPDIYGNDRSEELNLEDAYAEGIIYGWNNPNWISVDKELPPKRKDPIVISDKVFVHTTGGHYLSAVYDYQDKEWIDEYNIETLKSNEVTHWMEIVPPRKEE